MAILSSDGTYVTVERGDTLWGIAKEYLGSGIKYTQLKAIEKNKISNFDLIFVGQIIYLTNDGSSTTTSTSSNSNRPEVEQFGILSTTDDTLFASWTWSKSDNTASYKVLWTYDTGDGTWLVGSNSSVNVDKDEPSISRQATWTIPDNAKQVKFKVKPISETKSTSNNKTTYYWEADWSEVQTWTDSTPLETPPVPSVEIDGYKLTATLENLDADFDAEGIKFEIVKNYASNTYKTGKATIARQRASYSCTVDAGAEYTVRCQAYKGSSVSEWSNYSGPVGSPPAATDGITSLKALSETEVQIEWEPVSNAEGYDIQYTTKKIYFDSSSKVQSTSVDSTVNHAEITGLEAGTEYFFRVRAKNDKGDSPWCEIKSLVIGKKPAAPTTWSSTTTVTTGEPLTLYWIHNTEDNSSQTYADLELYVNDVKETYTIQNSTDEEEKDRTSFYSIDTSIYVEGTKIQWRVRTAGITKEYGDWSIQRTVDVYAPPTLELSMTDIDGNSIETLTSFPFYIKGLAGPNTQAPIGYQLTITSNEIYETVDNIGNVKMVNVGEQVYSKYFDITDVMLVEFSAGNIDLENNISYTVTCTVSMNSGLTAENSLEFTVSWTDERYSPNAEISLDEDTLTAYIMPYCEDRKLVYYKVEYVNDTYVVTTEALDAVSGELVSGTVTTTGEAVYRGKTLSGVDVLYSLYVDEANDEFDYRRVEHTDGIYTLTSESVSVISGYPESVVTTTTGEQVYSGMTADGDEVYYCMVEEVSEVEDVLLSVYRREFDGTFTELATGLESLKNTTITDPHPALDYARYRIVATTTTTGAVSYYDLPGYPIGGTEVIIQWDEDWSAFETSETAELQQPPWSGSMLKLPYNIDVSDNNQPDVSLVKYIGRKHPVSYYGTHLGEKSTWNVEIVKSDKETLYGLRRLKNWMGDVYVREPSGSGYWANITVSFSQKHRELTIPVTFTITRVEGGI